ncbi:MAG: tetratricopeptide repeat protein [Planctomycetota bacterium]|jgi:tetratricopeptide (TPR) repeat protein
MRRAFVSIAVFVAACSAPEDRAENPVYYDIGSVGRTVTTSSEEAQLWFDRGLAFTYGFNHAEAVICFERTAQLDPDCAMAYWGKAYALGPNYNNPAPNERASKAAYEALQSAKKTAARGTAAEQALIDALGARYAWPAPADRSPLDQAYAAKMRRVRARFPDDADVCALTGEALMQLRPWGLWSAEGKAAPETPEIRAVLEQGLARWPKHPALCHLYIHAMEAGPEVEKSIPAATRLENLTPGLGHLIHMPSHAYVWTGRYEDVIRTNIRAVEVDNAFADFRGRNNLYTAYRIHNFHFVAYGAMWDGQRELAMKYARAIPKQIPPELLAAVPDLFDIFNATPYHVMVRFGLWDELIAEPEPAKELVATRAVWHYARGIAYASLGQVEEAEREQAAFLDTKKKVPATRVLFNNPVSEILKVAEKFLDGEIEYRKKNYDEAFALLREAVELDKKLNYDEPWGWMEPVRHALGALLTEQKHYAEALDVYGANLARYPENGWALHGTAECLRGLGREEEAANVDARFKKAWARSDTEIPGSCFCKTG